MPSLVGSEMCIRDRFKGSKTEANLMAAFAGESQARNKYTYYASQAKKDGYEQIANIFQMTADNEKEHAKIWFKQLHGGKVPGTMENLLDGAAGEHYEWTDMYKLSLIHISEPTRLGMISYAVFCLKKKKNTTTKAASQS